MTDQRTELGSDESTRFLLTEYQHLADCFWRNEEAGEKRVNFFITLVTAVLAALVALVTKRGSLTDAHLSGIVSASCLALLAIGVLTFRRLIHRNFVTDGYKRDLDVIRQIFRDRDPPGLADYRPFQKQGARRFGRGGLTDLVAATNSVIAAAALAALVALSHSIAAVAATVALGAAAALALHASYLEKRYRGTWLLPRWRRLVPGPRSRSRQTWLLPRGRRLVPGPRSRSRETWLLPRWRRLLRGLWRPQELEATLVVVSKDPERVLHQVEELPAIAGFTLNPGERLELHDYYFDLPSGELGQKEIALRLRRVGDRWLITLKGPSREKRGLEGRLEIESDWSEKAWAEVNAKLEKKKIVVPPAAVDVHDPAATLKAARLEVVQERTTDRRVRDVVSGDGKVRRAAEMALDRVEYSLRGRVFRNYEVEVEAKSRRGTKAAAAVSEALAERFKPDLRSWHHGKLATGKALSSLLDERPAEELLNGGNLLKPSAYDAIERVLQR